jgi:hypothetical protein
VSEQQVGEQKMRGGIYAFARGLLGKGFATVKVWDSDREWPRA